MGGSDCERIRDAWLAQPVNAVSSLGFLAAGVYVLVRVRHAPATTRGIPVAGGIALTLVCFGSVAFHGPQPVWAGFAHDASIAAVLVVYLVAGRARDDGTGAGGQSLATGALVLAAASVILLVAPSSQWFVHGGLVVSVAVALVCRADQRLKLRRSSATTVAASALSVGVVLVVLGRTGGPLCSPESLVQAHAGWHVASALAAAAACAAYCRAP